MAGTGILNQNNFTNAGMSQLSISDQILIMRVKLEYFFINIRQLRENKKNLENENENLNCKINDLRLIIDRISKESDE